MFHLQVEGSGFKRTFPLTPGGVSVGRHSDNDIVIPLPFVSARWAQLEVEGKTCRFRALSETNPAFFHGTEVREALLQAGDVITIGPPQRALMVVRFLTELPADTPAVAAKMSERTHLEHRPRVRRTTTLPSIDLETSDDPVSIGRAETSTLRLEDLRVSRRHAVIRRAAGSFHLEDEQSANGVFVNGRRVARHILRDADVIRIGPYRLVMDGTVLRGQDNSRAVRLDAVGISRFIGGKKILDDVSLSVLPGELFAIAGISGAGKSTLMDALCGAARPDRGSIYVNGADLYASYDAVQPLFGFTPQKDIVHPELSVRRALTYAARLRLPPDVSRHDVDERVERVLHELELEGVADLEIHKLSGGQLKRASIGSELLTRPGLLFLDEPTTGLDPGLTRRLMEVARGLSRAGHTVVLVTHDLESLAQCDRMVFLAAGGRVAFIGTPAEALDHFGVGDLAAVYDKVEEGDRAERWNERPREGDVTDSTAPLRVEVPDGVTDTARLRARRVARRSFLAQFLILTQRRAEIMVRDRRNLLLLLAQAPAIGLLLALVFSRNALDPLGALAADTPDRETIGQSIPPGALASALPLILAATATWFGSINAAREIVRELPILARERQTGLRVLPYLASKMTILAALAAVQVVLLLGVVLIKVEVPMRGVYTFGALELGATLLLTALAASTLGLLVSASVSNADRAQSLVPIVLIPQIIFIGGPLAGDFSYLTSSLTITRWAIEAMKITVEIPYRGYDGFGGGDLLLRWAVLFAQAAVFFVGAAVFVRSKKARAA